MRVEIDDAGRDDHPLRVEDAPAIGGAEPPDARDATVPDADVGLVALRLRAVDDNPTPQDDVEVRHRLLSRGTLPPPVEVGDHLAAEPAERVDDVLVPDRPGLYEEEHHVDALRLVPGGRLDAPPGTADHDRAAIDELLEAPLPVCLLGDPLAIPRVALVGGERAE